MELLRIELESKKLKIESLKHEFQAKYDDMEERTQRAEHSARIYQSKISQLSVDNDQRKTRSQSDLQRIVQRQSHLESTNRKLSAEAAMLEEGLVDLSVDQDEYATLSIIPKTERTIQQMAKIKLYEMTQPVRSQCVVLQAQVDQLTDTFAQQANTLQQNSETVARLTDENDLLKTTKHKLETDISDARDLVALNHDKGVKYDHLAADHERATSDLTLHLARLRELESCNLQLSDRNKDLLIKYETTKQRESLLVEDKAYLKRINQEITTRKTELEEQNKELMDRNIQLQTAREEILEKYITGTDRARTEAQVERQNQIESLKLETDSELNRIKQNLHELFSRENNALREARDAAMNERDNLRIDNERTKEQIRAVQHELLSARAGQTAQMSEMQTRVQHAELESKRAGLARRELDAALDIAQRDAKASRSKAELLQRELYQMDNKSQKSQLELESEIRDISKKLTSYEKLEKELDCVVLQCADTEDEMDPERLLIGYGCGAAIPTNSRRRMQQSVRLAKRVLNLERINVDLQREIDAIKTANIKLKEQLESADAALDGVNQPYNYLVTNARDKDLTIMKLKQKLKSQQILITDLNSNVEQLKKV